jgi:RNA polymerase subunit RPABC4/transcription elongation factor Spt4
MTNLTTCKTCGVDQIPDTWFGECKRCYDMYDEDEDVSGRE